MTTTVTAKAKSLFVLEMGSNNIALVQLSESNYDPGLRTELGLTKVTKVPEGKVVIARGMQSAKQLGAQLITIAYRINENRVGYTKVICSPEKLKTAFAKPAGVVSATYKGKPIEDAYPPRRRVLI
jgi:hypothetical protein